MRRSQWRGAPFRRRGGAGGSSAWPRDDARQASARAVLVELETWRAHALPDAATPLEVGDLVRLLRSCAAALRLDPAIVAEFTTNTVHYYRRKDIIDPPDGRTAAARWSVRHLWQIAGARLAGHLGLVTLAQARDAIRGADTPALLDFLAARVVDARARDAMRRPGEATPQATAVRPLSAGATSPSPTTADDSTPQPATMIRLPGDVLCIVPANHVAHQSGDGARELGYALTRALLDGHRA